jgi:hypothetical protein
MSGVIEKQLIYFQSNGAFFFSSASNFSDETGSFLTLIPVAS